MAGIDRGGDVRDAAKAKRRADRRTGGQPAEPAKGAISFVRGESVRCSHERMLAAGALQIGYTEAYPEILIDSLAQRSCFCL